nr:WRKY4049 [Atractylodes chinensis]
MEFLVGKSLDEDEVHLNNYNISCLNPELPLSPFLAKLFLQENNSLTMVPPSFFAHMPVLQVLDLSHTSIQSLPPSISKLCLLEEFILRECSLLIEVPTEIGALENLKLFDLEGTEIMYLPKEIGKLETLERLRVSLSTYADEYKDRNGIEHIIPRMMISKLTKLKELSISVNPEAEWWEVEVLEAIMGDLLVLPDLKTLKLCLPTTKALEQFLRLERYQIPIYSSLWNFRFVIGHCEQPPFYLQLDIEDNFLKLEKCVKYTNGEGHTDEIVELIRKARALYLRRHWTIEKLSVFDIRRLKYCLLMECNEMQTLVDQEDSYEDRNKATNDGEDAILGSLEYLSIHFMKKLERIWKGPIGRSSLSCLRILALHTCPELTSIFTECLLDNLQSLTELIVEDCPNVKSLVTLEDATSWCKVPFLRNLKKVSLLDLPELVSISSGVCITPELDTLLVFNCMRLDYLSVMELPRHTKAIKGETEWWDALKYGKLMWNSVFVQFERDGDLMDQLAEDTNSLQHFLELQVVPPHPDISLQVDQNSSRDDYLGCHYQYIDVTEDREQEQLQNDRIVPSFNETRETSIQKILNSDNDTQSQYAGTAVRIWESPCPVSGKPHNEDTDCDFKGPNHKDASPNKESSNISIFKWEKGMKVTKRRVKEAVRVTKRIATGESLDDGYSWRKYGQKDILGSIYPRSYYRCTFKYEKSCFATKQVQRSTMDPSVFEVTYHGKHTCPRILSANCSSTATESAYRTLRSRYSSTATESASTITDSHFELATMPQVLDSENKKNSSTRNAELTTQIKVNVKAGFEKPPNDGYRWKKYGTKQIVANGCREYYQCISCSAKKRVERSLDDPLILEITYNGVHTCVRLSKTSDSTTATRSASSILENGDSSTAAESALRILKSIDSSTTAQTASTVIIDNSFGVDSTKKGMEDPYC